MVRFKRVRKWWRCAECGGQFPSSAPGCREHPQALMYAWTETLAAAYRVQLTRLERGEGPEVHEGLTGNTWEIAWRLAVKWNPRLVTDEVRGLRTEGGGA